MKTYTAEVQRDEKFWLIHVIEIDMWTQALHYEDVSMMASDLIETVDGIRSNEYDLRIKDA